MFSSSDSRVANKFCPRKLIEQADKGDRAVILTNCFCTKDEPGKKSNYLGEILQIRVLNLWDYIKPGMSAIRRNHQFRHIFVPRTSTVKNSNYLGIILLIGVLNLWYRALNKLIKARSRLKKLLKTRSSTLLADEGARAVISLTRGGPRRRRGVSSFNER